MGQIIETNYIGGNKVYHDTDDPDHLYGQIAAGIGWRGKRAGFVCIVGEDWKVDEALGLYHYHILKEFKDFDSLTLCRKALEFRDISMVKTFLADLYNNVEYESVYEVNEKLPYTAHLHLTCDIHAKEPDAFEFYLSNIERNLNPHKLLHFGESKVPEYLQEINNENRSSLSVKDYPAIVALGSVLGHMKTHKAFKDNEEPEVEYNPLTWGL